VTPLTKFRKLIFRRSFMAIQLASKILHEKMTENISLTDHSLKELKRLGYPYAKREPKKIHEPDWLVHKQKGDLVRSLGVFIRKTPRKFSAKVGCDETIAPHVAWIVHGTSKMVGRDFIRGSFEQVKDEIRETMRKTIVG